VRKIYYTYNEPKCDLFSRIIICVITCFQVIRIYVQSVHNGLDVMQECHLGGKGRRGLRKSYLWNSVAATKNNTLRRLRPRRWL